MAEFNKYVTRVPRKAHRMFLTMKMDRLLDNHIPVAIELVNDWYNLFVVAEHHEEAKRLIDELTGGYDHHDTRDEE